MEYIQTHPPTDPATGDLYTEGVRGDGGILVNKEGTCFIDELKTRDVVSEAILNQTDSIAYLMVSQNIVDMNKSLQGYIDSGRATEGATIADLADELDMDSVVLEETIASYNDAVASGTDAAGEVTGGVHGGNRIGGNAVLDIVVFGRIAGKNASEYIATLD